jgi:8-oxo-dGTP pyrophosphatase MutT (NUDIX family)
MQVITAAIIVREGRFLLAQRKDEDDDGGLWEFPGGRVEQGETPTAASSGNCGGTARHGPAGGPI